MRKFSSLLTVSGGSVFFPGEKVQTIYNFALRIRFDETADMLYNLYRMGKDGIYYCLLFFFSSGFSTEVVFFTTGSLPQISLPPRLVKAGPSWVTLEWTRPNSCSAEEVVTYTLEMQDETKVLNASHNPPCAVVIMAFCCHHFHHK